MLLRRAEPIASLQDAILSLQPTAYWPLDDRGSPLRPLAGGRTAAVTGTPTYGVAVQGPIERAMTLPGTAYAVSSTALPQATTALSAIAIFATTNATAASRVLLARYTGAQPSWILYLSSAHKPTATLYQSGGAGFMGANNTANANDGLWHLSALTYDGTTLGITTDGVLATSTSQTGAWHTAPTVAPSIGGSAGGATLYTGSLAHCAYWANRALTASELAWLRSFMRGG